MFADGPNPVKVQSVPPQKRFSNPTPLVLIHDGGGTTFSYFMIGNLGRDMWAVHNPNYFSGEPFEGGMDAMARHYIDLISKAGVKGPILLGGWSLGGYLSLAIARMLADEPAPKFSVLGMLIIDSPHHIPRQDLSHTPGQPVLEDLPDLITKSFDNCDLMLDNWALPEWQGPSGGGKTINVEVGGSKHALDAKTVLYKPYQGTWETRPVENYPVDKFQATTTGAAKTPPPAVLMRCVEPVPAVTADGTAEASVVDLHRAKTLLGWESTYPDYIKAVVDLDGHHYNMFDKFNPTRISYLTARINEAIEILESQAARPRVKQNMDFFF